MFTFSFSTAFAATSTNDYNGYVNLAEQQVLNEAAAVYNTVEQVLAKKTVDGVEIAADAWKVALDAHEADFIASVQTRTQEIKNAYVEGNTYTVAGIYAEYGASYTVTVAGVLSGIEAGTYLDKAAAAQFPVTKEAQLAKLATVDTTVYSAEVKKGDDESYQAIADAYIARMVEAINEIKLDSTPTASEVKTALDEIAKKVLGITEIKDEDGEGTGVYKIKDHINASLGILTLEEEGANAVTLEAKKAVKLSQIATAAANLYADAVAAKLNAADMADFVADKDAYVEMATYLVDIAESEADLAFGEPANRAAISQHAELLETYAELEAFAAKYAAETKDGVLVRDAEKIADVLEAAKVDVFKNLRSDLSTYEAKIVTECYVGNEVDEYTREVLKAKVEAARKAALENYYEAEHAAVNALYDEVIAKLDAAATDAELAKVKTTVTAAALKKAADDKTAVNADIDGYVATEFAKLAKYYDYATAGLTEAEKTDKTNHYRALINVVAPAYITADDWTVWYAEAGARTEAEVKALFAEATAVIDGLATKAELDAEKKEVEAVIAALPAKITSADQAAVEAAVAAVDAYKAKGRTTVANEATLNLAVKALSDAMKKDIDDAVKALPAAAKATVADKAAIQAVADMIEAYNDLDAADAPLESVAANFGEYTVPAKVTGGLATIKNAEIKAIEKAVNALPLNITLAEKDAVEAAKALYDAFVEEYTVIDADNEAADDARTLIAAAAKVDLAAAVKTIEELVEEAEAALAAEKIASVEGLKIKANSSAKKGSITVKWTATGNDEHVEKYQVYKSTKAQKGYKKAITTTKTSFKNTKNLKKGTRYYYKVRAIVVVDGTTYYSDWSNKANRIAK